MIGKVNWNPDRRQVKQFGWIFLIGFVGIAGVFLLKGQRDLFFVLAGLGVLGGGLSLFNDRPGLWIYRAWMAVGFVVGSVVSRILLLFIFYAVITPVAVWFKITGRDELRRKKRVEAESYWQSLSPIQDLDYYRHLF